MIPPSHPTSPLCTPSATGDTAGTQFWAGWYLGQDRSLPMTP
jgi:hypothetical protein